MYNKSPLYNAINARGRSQRLSPDFSSRVMCGIVAMERRRNRRNLVWSILGYFAAVAVTTGTLVCYCGDILTGMLHDYLLGIDGSIHMVTAAPTQVQAAQSSSYGFIFVVVIAAAILLWLDYLLRRRFALRRQKS